MGRGETFDRALRDYAALPDDAWERGFLAALLVTLRDELRRKGSTAPTEQELLMRYTEMIAAGKRLEQQYRDEGFAEGRREGLREGERDGHLAGLREAVLHLSAVLGVSLEDAQREAVASADEASLRAMIAELSASRAPR